jgi:hypothetical protein
MNWQQIKTWSPSLNFCAQSCHWGWGAFAVLAALSKGLPWMVLVLVGVAALKEFVFDLFILEHDNPGWPGSTQDFILYLIGGLTGYLMWVL